MSGTHAESAGGTSVTVIVNGAPRTAPAGTSVLAVVEALGLIGKPIAVEVDGGVVPRAGLAARMLVGGERIEIVSFVGGG